MAVGDFAPNKHMYVDRFDVSAELEEFGTGRPASCAPGGKASPPAGPDPSPRCCSRGGSEGRRADQLQQPGQDGDLQGRPCGLQTWHPVPGEGSRSGPRFSPCWSVRNSSVPSLRQVRMVGPDSKPVADEPVYVFAGDSQNLTLTTDAKGTATFSLDTALWRDTVVLKVGRRATTRLRQNPPMRSSIWCRQARSRKTEEHEPYEHNLRRPEYRSASHHAAAFYSRSRSFLKLMQVNGKLSCNEDAAVNVQYIIQGEELKKGQEVLDCFYLVGFW